MSDEPFQEHRTAPEPATLTGCRREGHEELDAVGQLLVDDASFVDDRVAVSVYTDRGPVHADKDLNQDFVLAWRPSQAHGPRALQFVLAIADGVSSSLYAEWASELACWAGVRALVANSEKTGALDLAHTAFNSAGGAVGRLADEITANSDVFRPKGEFDSTWGYRLRKGRLVQTTLFLAWIDADGLHAASVGDAGAVCRVMPSGVSRAGAVDQVVARCNLETSLVNAIGPQQRTIRQFDSWFETSTGTQTLFAAYTDGIARGLGLEPLVLLDRLEQLREHGSEHPSRCYTRQAMEQHPDEHDDNLSLCVLLYKAG